MKRRACDRCLGTDTQRECEQGQCYAEHYDQQQAEDQWRHEQEDWQRRCEEERG